jgi:hypothetical protein
VSWDIVPRSAPSQGLVVAVRIQRQLTEQLAVFREDPNLQIGDQDEDPRPGKSAAEPDVVQPAVVAKGDGPSAIDLVLADPVVPGDDEPLAEGTGLRPRRERLGRRAPTKGSVGTAGVVRA